MLVHQTVNQHSAASIEKVFPVKALQTHQGAYSHCAWSVLTA